jgi:uracil-DNA glycosylase family 4
MPEITVEPHHRELPVIQTEIRRCARCVDAGYIPTSNPILRGNTTARIMVIGQAPGVAAAERPVPYSGATGRTLQAWLARAGFPDDAFHDPDRFYLTSLTKCFPGKARTGAGDRAPSRREIAFCADHLTTELRLVQPELILSLGRLSIEAMLPSVRGLPLATIVGTPKLAELPLLREHGTLVLPLPHPSGVSRWLNHPDHRARVDTGIAWLAQERELRNW